MSDSLTRSGNHKAPYQRPPLTHRITRTQSPSQMPEQPPPHKRQTPRDPHTETAPNTQNQPGTNPQQLLGPLLRLQVPKSG